MVARHISKHINDESAAEHKSCQQGSVVVDFFWFSHKKQHSNNNSIIFDFFHTRWGEAKQNPCHHVKMALSGYGGDITETGMKACKRTHGISKTRRVDKLASSGGSLLRGLPLSHSSANATQPPIPL